MKKLEAGLWCTEFRHFYYTRDMNDSIRTEITPLSHLYIVEADRGADDRGKIIVSPETMPKILINAVLLYCCHQTGELLGGGKWYKIILFPLNSSHRFY